MVLAVLLGGFWCATGALCPAGKFGTTEGGCFTSPSRSSSLWGLSCASCPERGFAWQGTPGCWGDDARGQDGVGSCIDRCHCGVCGSWGGCTLSASCGLGVVNVPADGGCLVLSTSGGVRGGFQPSASLLSTGGGAPRSIAPTVEVQGDAVDHMPSQPSALVGGAAKPQVVLQVMPMQGAPSPAPAPALTARAPLAAAANAGGAAGVLEADFSSLSLRLAQSGEYVARAYLGALVPRQQLLSRRPSAVRTFVASGVGQGSFLVFANADSGDSSAASAFVYRLRVDDGESEAGGDRGGFGAFELLQSLGTDVATDVVAFASGGNTWLAVAKERAVICYVMPAGGGNSSRFVERQTLSFAEGVRSLAAFTSGIASSAFLAVAIPGERGTDSVTIYRMKDEKLVSFQTIASTGVHGLEVLTMGGQPTLVLANFQESAATTTCFGIGTGTNEYCTSNCLNVNPNCPSSACRCETTTPAPTPLPSTLYRPNSAFDAFEQLQALPTPPGANSSTAKRFHAFEIDGRFLLAACAGFGASSPVYRSGGAGEPFEWLQDLPTSTTSDATSFAVFGETHLAIANGNANSIVYRWSNATESFSSVQDMGATGATGVAAFEAGGLPYVAWANSGSEAKVLMSHIYAAASLVNVTEPFTVGSGALQRVGSAWSPSGNTIANKAFEPALTVSTFDAFSNTVVSEGTTMEVHVRSGPGVLCNSTGDACEPVPGGTVSVTALAGTARFPNLALSTHGAHTLAARARFTTSNTLVSAQLERQQHGLPTSGARAMAAVEAGGVQYVAVANEHDSAFAFAVKSAVYRRDGATGIFAKMTDFPTSGAVDVAAFAAAGERTFIAFAEYDAKNVAAAHPSGAGHTNIYRLNGDATGWDLQQSIALEGSRGVEGFTTAGHTFLAIACFGKHIGLSLSDRTLALNQDSAVYVLNPLTDAFELFQSIPSFGASAFEAFDVGGRLFLALANCQYSPEELGGALQPLTHDGVSIRAATTGRSYLPSAIFEFSGTAFEPWQRLPADGAVGFASFAAGGRTFLAVASRSNGTSLAAAPSQLYRLDEARSAFVHFQQLGTVGASGMTAFASGPTAHLAVAYAPQRNSSYVQWQDLVGMQATASGGLRKNGGIGADWDTGAISAQRAKGEVEVTFPCPAGINIQIGLSQTVNAGAVPNDIDCALWFPGLTKDYPAEIRKREANNLDSPSGVNARTVFSAGGGSKEWAGLGTCAAGEQLKMKRRTDGTVTYWKRTAADGWQWIGKCGNLLTEAVYIDTSFKKALDEITDVMWHEISIPKSEIYRLNAAGTLFEARQELDSRGAAGFAPFAADGRAFLAVAEHYDPAIPAKTGFDLESSVFALDDLSNYTDIAVIEALCSPCAAGFTCPSSVLTVECPAGHACTEGVKRACPAGKHQPSARQALCLDCKPGRYQGTAGSATCAACPVGTFRDTQGAAAVLECLPCPSGKFGERDGAASCMECPASKFSLAATATQQLIVCDACVAGTYSESSASRCTDCTAGRFGSATVGLGNADCLGLCPASKYADAPGSSACKSCAAGTHQPLSGRSFCQPCAVGTFSAAGAANCTGCTVGRWSAIAASECSACEQGRFRNASMAVGGCADCAAGEKPLADRTACAPFCRTGHFCQAGLELNCSLGFFQDEQGQAACKSCPSGKYQDEQAAPSCKVCTDTPCSNGASRKSCGGASVGYCGTCIPGTSVTNGVCAPCAAGRYSDKEDRSSCETCASGTFQREQGKAFCLAHSRCTAGQQDLEAPSATADRTCAPCEAGTFSDGAADCVACAAGTFQPEAGKSFCRQHATCAAGQHERQAPNATADRECAGCPDDAYSKTVNAKVCAPCAPCPNGARQSCGGASDGYCAACIPGTFATGSVCAPCTAGRFSDAEDRSSCDLCGVGRFQPEPGKSYCLPHTVCAKGERVVLAPNTTMDRRCQPCAVGTVSNQTNAHVCTACAAGSFQPEAGQASCTKHASCSKGERVAQEPNTTVDRGCVPCEVGRFGTLSNAQSCEVCPAGKHQALGGQTSCDACAAGKSGKAGAALPRTSAASHCEACPASTFSAAAGAESCLACVGCAQSGAARSGCSGASAGVCIACSVGTFKASSGSCEPCAAGSFQNATGQAQCIACSSVACPNGAHRKGCAGSSVGYCGTCSPGTLIVGGTCERCAAGRFSVTENAGACTACAASNYQPEAGKSFCLVHSRCTAGQQELEAPSATADRTCAPCEAGTFSDGAADCVACAAGTFQPEAGKSFCRQHATCAAGQHERQAPNATADRECAGCPDDAYSKTVNAKVCAPCAPCPNGARQSCGGASDGYCAACPAGTWYDEQNSTCLECPPGHWCALGKQQRCGSANLFCPSASATPSTVAVGHFSVPEDEPEDQRHGQLPCEVGFNCERGIRQKCPVGRVCQLRATARVISAATGNVTEVAVTAKERCEDDEYVFNGTCARCPQIGAQCFDGQIRLLPDHWFDAARHGSLPEFWGKRDPASTQTNIYRCGSGACVANATTQMPVCTEGRAGTLCAVCSAGFYATNGFECKRCPTTGSAAQYILALVFVICLGAALLKAKKRIEHKHPKLAAAMRAKLPEVLKLLTGLFQILGAFATALYRVPWPAAFTSITRVVGIVNLDLFALPTLRCSSLGSSYYGRFNMHLTTMLVLTMLFVALLLYSYSAHNASRQASGKRPIGRSLVWNIFLPFLFIIYPSISKTVILMLRCREIDGVRYLLADIALSCETAEYASHRNFAIFGVLVFPVGIVVFFTTLVFRNRRKLPPDWYPAQEPQKAKEAYAQYRKEAGRTMAKPMVAWKVESWDVEMAQHAKVYRRFGFLFQAYTKRFWWFESLITVYKLCMTVLILFVSDGDDLKILFGMLGATSLMAVYAFFQPFKHPDILSINTVAQLIILMVLFAAQFLLISGDSVLIAVGLVALTLAPLVAGIRLTLRLPEEAIVSAADDVLAAAMRGAAKSDSDGARGAGLPRLKSEIAFAEINPMHSRHKKKPLFKQLSVQKDLRHNSVDSTDGGELSI